MTSTTPQMLTKMEGSRRLLNSNNNNSNNDKTKNNVTASLAGDNNDGDDEDSNNDDHDDEVDDTVNRHADRLTLLPQPPPPPKRFIPPSEREPLSVKMQQKQQQKPQQKSQNQQQKQGTPNQQQRMLPQTKNRKKSIQTKRRRKYVQRDDNRDYNYYYDYNLLQSSFEYDPHPDSIDSVLRPAWLGMGLFLCLLSFWILDVLKDPILGALVHGDLERELPTAKLFSVCFTTALVLLLEYVSAEQTKFRKEQQRQKIRKRQQQHVQHQLQNNHSKLQHIQERSVMDVLNGIKWSQMETTSSDDYEIDVQMRSESHNDDDEWSEQGCNSNRVPSSIFTTIGIPYCIAFAIMAYLLQFHPSMEWKSTTANRTVLIEDDPTVPLQRLVEVDDVLSDTDFHDPMAASTMTVDMNYNNASTTITTSYYWHVLGYFWYATIESFGSIQVATFWSYTNSNLNLHEAERCYGYIISLAQLGAILGTTMVTTHYWSNITLIIATCFIILLHVLVMTAYSKRFPPSDADPEVRRMEYKRKQVLRRKNRIQQLFPSSTGAPTLTTARSLNSPSPLLTGTLGGATGGSGGTGAASTTITSSLFDIQTIDKSLWSGMYLLLKHNYVFLILGVSCLYEVSLTILNYQMTLLGWNRYEIEKTHDGSTNGIDDITFTQFMGRYGQLVNASSLVMSSIVFPLLIKHLGLRRTLWIFPTLLLTANVLAFGALPGNLTLLFIAMALLKAMTYSIHDPSKEILYMPTSDNIKFKSKFWIDVVGARLAKAVGSGINAHSGSVDRSIRFASIPSILTALGLWIACYRAGTQFEELIATGHIVGLDDDDNNVDSDNFANESIKMKALLDTDQIDNEAESSLRSDRYNDDNEDDETIVRQGRQRQLNSIRSVDECPESVELTAV